MQLSARTVIEQQMKAVAVEHRKRLAPLRDDLVMLESGLDSLCLAALTNRLEDVLGVDPFAGAEPLEQPVTLGRLASFYQSALNRSGLGQA
jgi:hypothetical protein